MEWLEYSVLPLLSGHNLDRLGDTGHSAWEGWYPQHRLGGGVGVVGGWFSHMVA